MAVNHHLRHLFLPHHTNNFRAKVLQLDFMAMYVVTFFIISLLSRTIQKIDPNILGFATNIHVQQLLSLTNQKRAASGVTPLRLDPQLSAAAAKKAEYMLAHNFWAHNAPDGTTPWDFINKSGYVYTVAGENLAKNFSDSQGVVDAWMNSSSHKENLLRNDYQDIGFAVVDGTLSGEETTLVVQLFGKRLTSVAQVKPKTLPPPPEFIASATAAEVSPQPAPIFQIVTSPSPVASPAFLAKAAGTSGQKQLEMVPFAESVVKRPLVDISSLAKKISLTLSTILIFVLLVDGYYIWRHKITRIGGHTIAHLVFLFMLSGTVWVMTFGSIL